MIPIRTTTPERVGEPVALAEATVQEIQLELLRRSSFNNLNGEQVVRDLMQHRDLWQSVLFDRLPIWGDEYAILSTSWLIKLRDLDTNIWNVDSLVVLTKSEEDARRLAEIATDDETHWGGEVQVYGEEHRAELDSTLGSGRRPFALLTVWWD